MPGVPSRVLEALWELLLQTILQALGANLDVSADFYGRFHFTLEVGLHEGPPLHLGPAPSSPSCLCPLPRVARPSRLSRSPGVPAAQHFHSASRLSVQSPGPGHWPLPQLPGS